MNKYDTFLRDLKVTLASLEHNKIKSAIGDSTNNNRTLTVNQFIRFLNKKTETTVYVLDKSKFKKVNLEKLAENTEVVYGAVKKSIARTRHNYWVNRTDAYDVNEFLTELRGYRTITF